MKRILILTFASIFLLNMFGLIPYAATLYENGIVEDTEITYNSSGFWLVGIMGEYILDENEEYILSIKIPLVNNQMPNKFDICRGATKTFISIENNEITYNNVDVSNIEFKNDVLKFNIKNTIAQGTGLYYAIAIKYYGTENDTVNLTTSNPILTIKDLEITAGDILIQNVSNAPKDVLREIVAILPVTLSVVITYLATRKGIAFVRSILESA